MIIHIPTPIRFANDPNEPKPMGIESLKKSDPTEFENLKKYYENLYNGRVNEKVKAVNEKRLCIIKDCHKYKSMGEYCTTHFRENQNQIIKVKDKITLANRGEEMEQIEKEIEQIEKKKEQTEKVVNKDSHDTWLSLATNTINKSLNDISSKAVKNLHKHKYDPKKASILFLNMSNAIERLQDEVNDSFGN